MLNGLGIQTFFFSKIRLWLKEKGCLLGSMEYILLEITCCNIIENVFTLLP
jgi:hypothetical protein